MTNEKKWYQSKTKWAAILIGLSPILATIGAMIEGSVDFGTGLTYLAPQIGTVLAVFGIRDLPFINRQK